jgi:periplasmic divalent cation tolerance protein
MAEPVSNVRIVLTSAGSQQDACRLARTLVEEHLAACATLIPTVQSVYRWKGNIESAQEALLFIKTTAEQIAALEARLHQLHSYQTPEFLVLEVNAGSKRYLDWLLAACTLPDAAKSALVCD